MTDLQIKNRVKDFAKIADWAFRQGWKERARMTAVSKHLLDAHYYKSIKIMLENKHYLKAFDNPYLGGIQPNDTKEKVTIKSKNNA